MHEQAEFELDVLGHLFLQVGNKSLWTWCDATRTEKGATALGV